MKQDGELYRPVNGTEGMIFMEQWCNCCEHDKGYPEDDGCQIIIATTAYNINSPGYPKEWCYKDGKPVCTKFAKIEEPPVCMERKLPFSDKDMEAEEMETGSIDKLFLELSQITKAKTASELEKDGIIAAINRRLDPDYDAAIAIIEDDMVHEALGYFAHDATDNNAVAIVHAIADVFRGD